MKTYYQLIIEKTARPMGGRQQSYSFYDREVIERGSIADCMTALREQVDIDHVKRVKMYQDGDNGSSTHCGYIYCFNTPAYSYDDCKHHEQWWINIKKLTSRAVNPSEWGTK